MDPTIVFALAALVVLCITLNSMFIISEIKKVSSEVVKGQRDAQQIKTAQRASKKRELYHRKQLTKAMVNLEKAINGSKKK